ncbi:hypothetical protein KIN20_001673 [Parelaphostrongylus tenuis]|uniref:FERM N-terminal domain-containing protein n=1 Tax=Parelaphostrongylus tenuis TaxID=148309 RepID=A0AAD5MFC3_PARTN|nr:hypothetical protein KIN20_001673 [Parelaphostrongylus tenuis]
MITWLQRHACGSVLLDKVFTHLELIERDFFGLQFLYVLGTKETQKSTTSTNTYPKTRNVE